MKASSSVALAGSAPVARRDQTARTSGRGSILFLVSHSSPGGVQEIWANLAEGFHGQGFDVGLVALYPCRSPARETAAFLPWRYVVPERPRSIVGMIRLLRNLVRMLAVESPQAVLTAMPAANILAAAAVTLARTPTRVVISHHTPVQTYNPILNALDGLVGCLACVRRIVSVSNTVGASLAAKPRAYRAKRQTIANALPPRIETYLSDLAASRSTRAAGRRRVVATGRLAPQKNYPVLIRAAALMPDVEVRIIGTGPDEAQLKALAASLGVEDRVMFLGHFPREAALSMLADGDVFAQPSLFEGHSLALIEAAALGLPLVVSDAPVQIEGVTAADGSRCGLVVGVEDHAGLARAILGLLDDPASYAAWGTRARHLAETNTYERMIEAYSQQLVSLA